MKNQLMKWISGAALLLGFAMFLTQCETDLNTIDNTEALDPTLTALGGGNSGTQGSFVDVCTCLTDNFPYEELSPAEIEALTFMREEEKMARDVYTAMAGLYDLPIFANIANAEQRHMNLVGCLLDKYDLADPIGDDVPGEFSNADIQTLYNNLLALGQTDLLSALTAGATIEDRDIADLLERTGNTDVNNEDILAVFTELTKASRNHMRAFVKKLAGLDVTYVPQYITQEYFDSFINLPWEKGGSICGTCPNGGPGNGNGNGNGPGNGNGGICPNGNGGGNGPGGGNGNGNGNGNGPGGGNGNGPGNGNGGTCPNGN